MEQWAIPLAWLAWLALWALLSRRVKPVAARVDRASQLSHYLPLMAAALLLAYPGPIPVIDARLFPFQPWAPPLGLALVLVGLGYAIWARLRLGGNWSSDVTLKEGHELIVAGPYRWTRHPIYTGLLLAFAGTALAIGEWRGALALALVLFAFWRKIGLEEAMMRREFGAAYADYARRVRALIPLLL
jgi:protein-S-isoprenylcysteine O-methyltransferase Ste14